MGSSSCLDTPRETTVCMHEYCVNCEKSHVMIEACAYLDNNQTARITKLGVPNVASICNENKTAIHEVDGTHALVLSINDPQEQLSVCDLSHLTSDENVLEPKKTETHQDLCLPTDWNVKKQKALAKSATFPLPLAADDSDLSIGGACCLPSTELENQCSSTKSNPTYERSISLPVPPKLISAVKGSRAQHGSPSNLKLHVKWAPDVYDPPCTLLSHTVKKNHHQLPKARKNYSNKHRTKSARGSNNDRRTANRSLTSYKTESFNARLQTVRNSRLVLKEYGKSSTEGAEYAVNNQDSKCGGSFLVEALTKVNIL